LNPYYQNFIKNIGYYLEKNKPQLLSAEKMTPECTAIASGSKFITDLCSRDFLIELKSRLDSMLSGQVPGKSISCRGSVLSSETCAPAFACGLQRARTKLARRMHFAKQMMTDGFWPRKRERERERKTQCYCIKVPIHYAVLL
jgi:hypothetical protein